MAERLELTSRVMVLQGAVNMTLVRVQNGVVAIDTGLDKSSGKALLREAAAMNAPMIGVINTHAHADHFGGNRTILAAHPAKVYAPMIEADVILRPLWEPEYLWMGADPPRLLQNKFLLAPASPVDETFAPGESLLIDGVCFQTVALPGHSKGQSGVLVDGVLVAADAYFGREVTQKHGIPFLVDFPQTISSARAVAQTPAEWYVPGHGAATENPSPDIDYLCERHQEIYTVIGAKLETGWCTLEDVVAHVILHYELAPQGLGPYTLLRTSVAAYLSEASNRGDLTWDVRDGRLCAKAE